MNRSDEMVLAQWFKRLTAIELIGGGGETHGRRFIAASY